MAGRKTLPRTLTAARLRELLRYDQETGSFVWLAKTSPFSRVSIGDEAGTLRADGYRAIAIDGALYLAHRLAWLYVHGEWPNNEVDHLDGDRANNRFTNLRDVEPSTNRQNMRRATCRNQSGLLGVSTTKKGFVASIGLNGKVKQIGVFKDAADAHEAYVRVKRVKHEGCTL